MILLAFKAGYGQFGNWEIVNGGKLPAGLSGLEAVVVDSTIYILGGYSDSAQANVNTIYAYKPLTNTWSVAGKMLKARKSFLADKIGSKIYYFGGEEKNSKDTAQGLVEVFDTKTNTVTPFFYNKAFNRNNLTGVIEDSVFYIIGGQLYNEPAQTKQWQNFSFDTRSKNFGKMFLYVLENWTIKGEMSALLGRNIFIFGGIIYSMINSVVFANIDNNLTEIDRGWYMNGARSNGRAVKTGANQIMIIGGFNEISMALNTADIYTIKDTLRQPVITPAAPMFFKRKDFAAVLFQDYVYVFGGLDETGRVPYAIERYKVKPVTVMAEKNETPTGFSLSQNYPNPFNPSTTISYSLPNRCFVNIKVFDALGSQVAELVNETKESGSYSVNFNASGIPSGIYFYRITASGSTPGTYGFTESRKMVLLK